MPPFGKADSIDPSQDLPGGDDDACSTSSEAPAYEAPPDYNASAEQIFEKGVAQKAEGTEAYKDGNVAKAIELWQKSQKTLQTIAERKQLNAKKIEAEADQVVLTVELNLAQAYLKNQEFHKCIVSCDKVLDSDESNVKALYRKASAQMIGSDFERSRETLSLLLEVEPDNAGAKQLMKEIDAKEKASNKSGKETAQRMLSGMGNVFAKGRKDKEKEKPVATPEPNPEDEQPKELVNVTFRVEKQEPEGCKIFVYGAPECLGSWDASKAIEMRKLPPKWEPPVGSGRKVPEKHIWETVVDLHQDEAKVEYKYFFRGPGKSDDFETGANHAVNVTGLGGSRQRITDSWRTKIEV